MLKKIFSSFTIILTIIFSSFASNPLASADGVPMTIDGQINCAHPDNAITTTCRGEAPPPPPPVTPEAAPAGTTITHSGDTAINCGLPENQSNSICFPMTIDGQINCAQADNALTTTCRGEAPPPPAPTPPVTTEAAPVGTTITYSGDRAINCALPENKDDNICLPMTHSDGSINCAQADNAITTTCWERAQTLKKFGATETEVDCTLDRFKDYPVCTGIKPQAVIDYEKSQEASTKLPLSITQCAYPAFINSAECKNRETLNGENQQSSLGEKEGSPQTNETSQEKSEVKGSIDLKSRSSKSTVLVVNLDKSKVQIRIVASKKGAPSITRELTTDINGDKTVKFGKNLKGYTVKIIVDGELVDQTKI